MSDQPGPSAAAGGVPPGMHPGGEQPSEEEMRQALSQMRGAPIDQLLAEVVNALLQGAQVKLGRRDGRLLLDLVGLMTDTARPHLDEKFSGQIDDILAQLRMAQVEAENEVNQAKAQGHQEPNDLDQPAGTSQPGSTQAPGSPPEAAEGAPTRQASAPPSQQQSAASRLWVPGQG